MTWNEVFLVHILQPWYYKKFCKGQKRLNSQRDVTASYFQVTIFIFFLLGDLTFMSLLVLIRWCVLMQSRVCAVVYVAMHMWLYVDGWSFPTGFSLPVPSSASLHTFILQLRTATDSARLFPVCIFMAVSVGVGKKKERRILWIPPKWVLLFIYFDAPVL